MKKNGKVILLATVITFFSVSAFAQRGGIPASSLPPVDITTTLQSGILSLDNIAEAGDKESDILGTVYLADEWLSGTLYTSSGHTVTGVLLKYDLQNHIVEIVQGDQLKVLSGEFVKKFEVLEDGNVVPSVFINAKQYEPHNSSFRGFYKLSATGPRANLLSKIELREVKENYSAIMDVGNKRGIMVPKETFYLESSNSILELKDRNDFHVFGEVTEQMKRYAKKNKLKMRRKGDLIQLVTYYNTL